jgi:hypothetical protein
MTCVFPQYPYMEQHDPAVQFPQVVPPNPAPQLPSVVSAADADGEVGLEDVSRDP